MSYDFMEHYLAKPDESLASHNANLKKNLAILLDFGYLDPKFKEILEVAIDSHDIGKMNVHFQQRVQTGGHFDKEKEIGHNILSVFFVDLEERLSKEDYYKAANIVLNHHHYVNNYDVLEQRKEDESLNRIIQSGISDIVEGMKKYGFNYEPKDFSTRKFREIRDIANQFETRLLQGFLHKCDYAASAGLPIEYKNDFLSEKMKALNYTWNELQLFCRDHQGENLLISAPTGMGKTEASLLWLGNDKGFYVLPLKTAINAIYERIRKNILCEDNIEERVALLHGESMDLYFAGGEESEYDKINSYYQRTRNLSLPLTVTTPDQIFDFVYKYEGYETKFATLSYSKVIIDEIQAYSPDLLAYLVYGIQQLVMAGGKFAVFTATFPPFIRELLAERKSNGESEKTPEDEERIQRAFETLNHLKHERFSSDLKRHHIFIRNGALNAEDIREVYAREEEKKLLVVCNTVRRAQELYEELKAEGEVHLLHAKYIQMHRRDKERRILSDGETFRTEGIFNDKKVIWIATQIVEASLDIDFDYIFTELTDLNGLLQRLGRCNRKGKKTTEEANCFIYTEINPHLFMNGDKGFIDKTLYDLSVQALEQHGNGLFTEDEKFELIDEYFTLKRIQTQGSEFYTKYKEIYKWIHGLYYGQFDYTTVKETFRNIISYKVIPEPVYDEYRAEIDNIRSEWQEIDEKYRKKSSRSELSHDETKKDRIRKSELKRMLNLYCVSVGMYDIPTYLPKEKILSFGKEEIKIVPCEYSEEIGFQRASPEILKNTSKSEESFDAFF